MSRPVATLVIICLVTVFAPPLGQVISLNTQGSNPCDGTMSHFPNTLKAAERVRPDGLINVRQFGAVGDGVTDDTAAICAAIRAAGRGGRVFLPKGLFRVTSPIMVSYGLNEISIVGEGEGSAIVPDLDPNTDACFVLGSNDCGVYNLHFADFAIVGPPNSCKYGIRQILGAGCTFDRINLCCGATEYGYYGEGVISNTFNQSTVAGYQGGHTYSRPKGGWHVTKHAATGTQPNLNRWIGCSSQGQATYGVCLEYASGGYISGQYEFAGIADVRLYKCDYIKLANSYSEGGAWKQILEDCSRCDSDNYYGNGGGIDLLGGDHGSNLNWLRGSWFWTVTVDANNSATTLGPALWTGTFPDLKEGSATNGLKDSGWGTVYYPPLFYTPTGNPDRRANVHAAPYAPSEFHNLLGNSSMASWDDSAPTGWTPGWRLKITQTGSGCLDADRHIAPYAAMFSNLTANNDNSLDYSIREGNDLAPLHGRMVTFSAWIKPLDTNAVSGRPAIWAALECPSSSDFVSVASSALVDVNDVGVWRRHYTSFYVPEDCAAITLKTGAYSTFGKTAFLFAEPCLMLGLYGQNGWIPSYGEFKEIQLGRHYLHGGPSGIGVNAPDPTTVWDVNGVVTLRKTAEPPSPPPGMVNIYLDSADGSLKAKGDRGQVVVLGHLQAD